MKYIIVIKHDIEMAVIFDEILQHSDVAVAFGNVVSAGMCSASGNAYGKSISLKLESRPEDSDIVKASMKRTI
jgi:hypothetical protein